MTKQEAAHVEIMRLVDEAGGNRADIRLVKGEGKTVGSYQWRGPEGETISASWEADTKEEAEAERGTIGFHA